jgi:hypothetical protein
LIYDLAGKDIYIHNNLTRRRNEWISKESIDLKQTEKKFFHENMRE